MPNEATRWMKILKGEKTPEGLMLLAQEVRIGWVTLTVDELELLEQSLETWPLNQEERDAVAYFVNTAKVMLSKQPESHLHKSVVLFEVPVEVNLPPGTTNEDVWKCKQLIFAHARSGAKRGKFGMMQVAGIGSTTGVVEKMSKRVLVVCGEHENQYYDISTPSKLSAVSLKLLQERIDQWEMPEEPTPPSIGMTEAQVNKLPSSPMKKSGQFEFKSYRANLEAYEEANKLLQHMRRAVSEGNGQAAYRMLMRRAVHEGRKIEIVEVEDVARERAVNANESNPESDFGAAG